MKKIVALILAVSCICCSMLVGCSGGKSKDDGKLQVYYSSQEVGFRTLFAEAVREYEKTGGEVEVTVFATNQEMDKVVTTELMSGEGPDVILSTCYGSLDFEDLAQKGYFADLTQLADAEFDATEHYTNVLKGARMDGKQYVIPCSFSVPTIMTMQEMLDAHQLVLPQAGSTGEDWGKALLSKYDTNAENLYGFSWSINSAQDMVLTDIFDLPLLEKEKKTVLPKEADFAKMEEVAKMMTEQTYTLYETMKKQQSSTMLDQLVNHANDLAFVFSLEQFTPRQAYLTYCALQNSGKSGELQIHALPQFGDSSVTALASTYGAVVAGSEKMEQGFQFLKTLATQKYDASNNTMVTLDRESVKQYAESLGNANGVLQGSSISRYPMTKETMDMLVSLFDVPSDCTLACMSEMKSKAATITYEYRKKDGEPWENVLPKLKDALEFYVSE